LVVDGHGDRALAAEPGFRGEAPGGAGAAVIGWFCVSDGGI
jgi:hypothetical protein